MKQVEATQDRRQQMLLRGLTLIRKKGYHGTGLNEILTAIGIPKGSFYNYYPSKDAFVVAMITYFVDQHVEQVKLSLALYPANVLKALQEFFSALALEYAEQQFTGGCLMGNLIGEIGDTNALAHEALKQGMERFHSAFATGLKRGQVQGSIRNDKSAEVIADVIIHAWQGALLRAKVERSDRVLRQFIDELVLDWSGAVPTPTQRCTLACSQATLA
jgi:TetR/AcrR family transcriptional repressor of nem operon